MRRLFRLPVLALFVWTAFVGLLVLLFVMVKAGAWHPHFAPVTALLAVLAGSGLALFAGGIWRVIRGPGRLRAVTWLFLGVAPLLFFTGFILYGLRAGFGRQIELKLPLKMLMPLGESVFDLLTRFEYPVRTEGETVVMISTPAAYARAQVDAMDRHVRSLWNRLGGKTTSRRVHWVRGSLLGIGGKAINGICLGSRPGDPPRDAEGLNALDRHEVAHCALSSFASIDNDPPAVLTEGWAEANMGQNARTIAVAAWDFREQGSALSLRELVGSEWYSRHHRPVYVQGAALVNHILRTFGPARFLELCTTCRKPTFANDCQRILGVSLDQLDAGYWSDIEQTVGHDDLAVARLRGMTVRPPVTGDAWNAFLDEYVAQTRVLTATYEHVRISFERVYEYKDEQGQPVRSTDRGTLLRSDDSAALRLMHPKLENVWLATPALSFEAARHVGARGWEVRDAPRATRAATYRRAKRRITRRDPVSREAALLLAISDELGDLAVMPGIVVTRLERFEDAGHPMVRVRLEDPAVHPVQWRALTIVMAAEDWLAPRTLEVEFSDGSTSRSEITYDRGDGQPVLHGIRRVIEGRAGKSRVITTRVVQRAFGPIPAPEFTEAKLLDGPVVHKPAPTDSELYQEPITFADWYATPLIAGGVSLACGLVTGFMGRLRCGDRRRQ
jgi:hypothetical protein